MLQTHSYLEQKVADIAAPVIEDAGYRLVCVLIRDREERIVQIMAENPDTGLIGLDECAALSRSLSAVMDVEDPIKGHYRLEVSSPGIDRPLTAVEDFETYAGFEARIEIDPPLPEGRKRFRGPLKGLEPDGQIAIQVDDTLYKLDAAAITKASLVLSDELIAFSKQRAQNAPVKGASEDQTQNTDEKA